MNQFGETCHQQHEHQPWTNRVWSHTWTCKPVKSKSRRRLERFRIVFQVQNYSLIQQCSDTNRMQTELTMYLESMKGSFTATISTSSMPKITRATSLPILPKPDTSRIWLLSDYSQLKIMTYWPNYIAHYFLLIILHNQSHTLLQNRSNTKSKNLEYFRDLTIDSNSDLLLAAGRWKKKK